MVSGDTIAAISSSAGPAVRIILRLSGPDALSIAERFTTPQIISSGASRQMLCIRALAVPVWIYCFQAPRSYTGEDLVEFHLPGNPLLAKILLEELLRTGARAAEPGEFTARAYFNGRLDLTAAEGVAATISAGNEQELSAARRLLSGELARRLAPVIDRGADTLALLEVGIDFSDEDVTFLSADDVAVRIADCDGLLGALLEESARFERLAHEPSVVVVGRPNAGKSTLLNALAGRERAVVSPIAGTTRDVLSAEAALPRGMIRLADVAGLEDDAPGISPTTASDAHRQIDTKMREHALRALEEADHVLLVRDAADSRPALTLPRPADLIVISKIDLAPPCAVDAPPMSPGHVQDACLSQTAPSPSAWAMPHVQDACLFQTPSPAPAQRPYHTEGSSPADRPVIRISALTGAGLVEFRHALDRLCFGESSATASLALNARHVQAIEEARAALAAAAEKVHAGPEFIAIELRDALDALGRVSGKISPDDLLGRIFSAFCIGK